MFGPLFDLDNCERKWLYEKISSQSIEMTALKTELKRLGIELSEEREKKLEMARLQDVKRDSFDFDRLEKRVLYENISNQSFEILSLKAELKRLCVEIAVLCEHLGLEICKTEPNPLAEYVVRKKGKA